MSPNQNKFTPRPGQAEVVDYIRAHPSVAILPVKFPGGYGKTAAIALAYQQKREAGQCNRLLIVVANDVQLGQIQNEFESECNRIGFSIPGGVYPCDSAHNPLGVSRNGTAEVFVTTIQRVSSTNRKTNIVDILRQLLSRNGQWMLAADEYHHYATGNDWGVSLQRLVDLSVFTIATSATPDRDNEPTIFSKPIILKSYREAMTEKAVKELQLHHCNYRVVAEDIPTQRSIEFTTEQLRNEAIRITGTEDIDAFFQKRQLRYHPDYISPLLQRALNALLQDKIRGSGFEQLLVRAFSCNHAKHLCEQINGYGYGLSCDWIGTKSDFGGRPDEENDMVKKRFCPPKDAQGLRPHPSLDVLVQVGMAGEGFDSILVSQIVDLSLVALKGNANQTKQFFLRGSRWISGLPEQCQVCQINVGTDHPILNVPGHDLAAWLDSNCDFSATTDEPTQPKSAPEPDQNAPIDPDWQHHFANLKEVELIAVSRDDPLADHLMSQIRKTSTAPDYWSWDNPQAVDQLTRLIEEYQRNQQAKRQDLNELGKQDFLRNKINLTVKKTANQLVERLQRPRSEIGQFTRLIFQRLKAISGSYLREAGSAQLQLSWDFAVTLHNNIAKGDIPSWLR